MSIFLISLFVFLAVSLGATALLLHYSRSGNPIDRRLEKVHRDGQSGGIPGRRGAPLPPEGLIAVGTKSFTDLRQDLAHAGFRGKNALSLYFVTRFIFVGVFLLIGLWVQRVIAFTPIYGLLLMVASAAIGFALPAIWVYHRVTKRREEIRRAVPGVLDLIIVCVEAGLSLNAAIVRIAGEMKGTYKALAEELNLVNQEIFIGKSRTEAFRNLALRTGVDELRSLATVLMQSDRMGTSIADLLRVQADSLRAKRRQRALEAAHKTPVKLVFPLVLFIFPELLVILLGPAGIQLFRALTDMSK